MYRREQVVVKHGFAALKLGRSEMMSGGRRKMALLGDAMERRIGSLAVDTAFGDQLLDLLRANDLIKKMVFVLL